MNKLRQSPPVPQLATPTPTHVVQHPTPSASSRHTDASIVRQAATDPPAYHPRPQPRAFGGGCVCVCRFFHNRHATTRAATFTGDVDTGATFYSTAGFTMCYLLFRRVPTPGRGRRHSCCSAYALQSQPFCSSIFRSVSQAATDGCASILLGRG